MKTNNLIIGILCSFFLTTSLFAEEFDTSKTFDIPAKLKRNISLKMQFPEQINTSNLPCIVTACFVVSASGNIEVKCINGQPEFNKSVKSQLESIKVNQPQAYVDKPMIIRIKFTN